MKIHFRENQIPQAAVSPAQTEMKKAKPRKIPVFKIFLVLALLALAGWGIYSAVRSRSVYTFGLVSGPVHRIVARTDSIVSNVYVRPGDMVSKGQGLFELIPTNADKIKEAQEALRLKERDLNAMKKAFSEFDPDLRAAGKQSAPLPEIRQRAQQDRREQSARLQAALDTAELEVKKLTHVYSRKKKRHASLKYLFSLDAAVKESLDAAETEMRLSLYNLGQAEIALRLALQAKERVAIRDAVEIASLESDSRIAKAKLEKLKKKYGAVTFKALFDGIIREVQVTDGQFASKNQLLATSFSYQELWIDTYVPPEKAAGLKTSTPATVYTTDGSHAIAAVVAQNGRAAVRVPELLGRKFPGQDLAVYFRLNVNKSDALIPGNMVRVVFGSAAEL